MPNQRPCERLARRIRDDRLICYGMTSCQVPTKFDRAWPALTSKRQLAGLSAFSSDDGSGVQGRRRRRPQGAKPWTPSLSPDIRNPTCCDRLIDSPQRRPTIRGRFDDESR